MKGFARRGLYFDRRTCKVTFGSKWEHPRFRKLQLLDKQLTLRLSVEVVRGPKTAKREIHRINNEGGQWRDQTLFQLHVERRVRWWQRHRSGFQFHGMIAILVLFTCEHGWQLSISKKPFSSQYSSSERLVPILLDPLCKKAAAYGALTVVACGMTPLQLTKCKLNKADYGKFLSGKWSEHENRKSEIRKSKNRKSIIY
jgi:hypothetical protein